MHKKILIIGASTTGKSTLLKGLEGVTDVPISEIDSELTLLNGGTFPQDIDYKLKVLAPKVVADILSREEIIFFTNTDYFSKEDLVVARQKGFFIVLLVLSRQEMEVRNKQRVANEGYDDLSQYFDTMLLYQKEIQDAGLVDVVLEAHKPPEELRADLIEICGT